MVYILHFEKPFHHARHYVGCTEDTERRFREHFRQYAKGSPLVSAVIDAGIGVEVAVIIEGGFDLERAIKRQSNTPRFCPLCGGKHAGEILEFFKGAVGSVE